MKLCKDCKWCSEVRFAGGEDFSKCSRMGRGIRSKTTGDLIPQPKGSSWCELARGNMWPFECGRRGHYWKAKK